MDETVDNKLTRTTEEIPEEEEFMEITPAPVHVPIAHPQELQKEKQASVFWGIYTVEPRRIVDDDSSVVMEINDWQHLIKDEEDLAFLRKALEGVNAAKIGDAHTWTYKQKQIKPKEHGHPLLLRRTDASNAEDEARETQTLPYCCILPFRPLTKTSAASITYLTLLTPFELDLVLRPLLYMFTEYGY
jgi:hypothetical protein